MTEYDWNNIPNQTWSNRVATDLSLEGLADAAKLLWAGPSWGEQMRFREMAERPLYHPGHLGTRIIEDASLVDAVGLDWSGCRSIARAKRRSKYGHRQRVKTAYTPKKEAFTIDGGRTFVIHPEMARVMREQMHARINAQIEKQKEHAMLGVLQNPGA